MALPTYFESDEANQLFRMIVALLGKHKIPPNIINIHLLYDYVSETNAGLAKELKPYLEGENSYSKKDATDLYRKFILDKDKAKQEELKVAIDRYFNGLIEDIKKLNEGNSHSNNSIKKDYDKLQKIETPNEIKILVESMVTEFQSVIETNTTFEKELSSKQNELNLLRKELEKTKDLADKDPLTKLKNRRFFERFTNSYIDKLKKREDMLSLIVIDIDFFKKVNDTYGHVIGDKMIILVADTIREVVSIDSISARVGGEEYAILLPKITINETKNISENIRKAIEKKQLLIKNGKEKIAVTVSIGVTGYKTGEDYSSFFHRADEALYCSKDNGRNQVSVR
jgi:diguanylate cyclase